MSDNKNRNIRTGGYACGHGTKADTSCSFACSSDTKADPDRSPFGPKEILYIISGFNTRVADQIRENALVMLGKDKSL